jgi:hypothetical protein
MVQAVKIDLNKGVAPKFDDNFLFGQFAIYALEQIVMKNSENWKAGNKKIYTLSFDYDNLEIKNNLYVEDDIFLKELKSVSLDRDEYLNGDKTDEDLLKSLLSTIQSDSEE